MVEKRLKFCHFEVSTILQIITLEKKYKMTFLWKKMTPKLVVLQSWKKSPSSWKKVFSEKKSFQLVRTDTSSKWCADIFWKQVRLKIFNFWWFYGSEKFFFTIKWWIKNQSIGKTSPTAFWQQLSHKSSCKISAR